MTYQFANILFTGGCNLRCPDCIGKKEIALRRLPGNLSSYPLAGQERFVELLSEHGVREVTLTGTNTDPLLHRHLARIIGHLKEHLPGVRLNLHTNGVAALERMEVFNSCHRACVSLPSFNAETAEKMTGSGKVLDLAEIIRAATIPVKVSVLLTEHNFEEVPEIIARCGELGVERMVLRQPYEPAAYSGPSRWEVLADQDPVGNFAGNPVYQLDGVEVTVWDFIATDLGCINLYSDGSINDEYLLARGINDPFGGAGGAL